MRAAAATPARPGSRPASRRAGRNTIPRGQKLVVQMVETFREHMQPAFVEKLDAWS
jgi:malonate decarboxylase alpha subunit